MRKSSFLLTFTLNMALSAHAMIRPPTLDCSQPLRGRTYYRILKAILSNVRSGATSGRELMDRAQLNEVQLRQHLDWLKNHQYLSVFDLTDGNIRKAFVSFTPTQETRAANFVLANEFLRTRLMTQPRQAALENLRKLLRVFLEKGIVSGYQLHYALRWPNDALLKMLQQLKEAEILQVYRSGTLVLSDHFVLIPDARRWVQEFLLEMSVPNIMEN